MISLPLWNRTLSERLFFQLYKHLFSSELSEKCQMMKNSMCHKSSRTKQKAPQTCLFGRSEVLFMARAEGIEPSSLGFGDETRVSRTDRCDSALVISVYYSISALFQTRSFELGAYPAQVCCKSCWGIRCAVSENSTCQKHY